MTQTYQPVIRHYDERYVQINLDFLLITSFSQPKAAMLWMLEEAQEKYIPLTLDNFGPVGPQIGLDSPETLERAIQEMVMAGYILQNPDGAATYAVNFPIVQQALDAINWTAVKAYYPELEIE